MIQRPAKSTLFPHTPLFRSAQLPPLSVERQVHHAPGREGSVRRIWTKLHGVGHHQLRTVLAVRDVQGAHDHVTTRSEEHTSELQSRQYLVCRLLLEKKKKI